VTEREREREREREVLKVEGELADQLHVPRSSDKTVDFLSCVQKSSINIGMQSDIIALTYIDLYFHLDSIEK